MDIVMRIETRARCSANRRSSEQPEKKQNTRWRKCPICDDTIYLSDVRPVRFYAGQECPLPRKGDYLRNRFGSTLPSD